MPNPRGHFNMSHLCNLHAWIGRTCLALMVLSVSQDKQQSPSDVFETSIPFLKQGLDGFPLGSFEFSLVDDEFAPPAELQVLAKKHFMKCAHESWRLARGSSKMTQQDSEDLEALVKTALGLPELRPGTKNSQPLQFRYDFLGDVTEFRT